jgi:hypothetical protein
MPGGWFFGSGCGGPNGEHVIAEDHGTWLYCILCDSSVPAEGNMWWRKEKPPQNPDNTTV